MSRVRLKCGVAAIILLSGCATPPIGPTARVMPAPGKPFQVFAADQSQCKQYADGEVSGAATIANLKEFGTVAVSTALGAGLGASLRGGRGAGIGGALGSMAGAMAGGRGSASDQHGLQGRYDLAYTQCMYSHGNQIAGAARPSSRGGYGMASAVPLPRGIGGPGPAPGLPAPPGAFDTGIR